MASTTSERQLMANQKNAKLGGVKTAAGKAVSSKNATKYGIFSKATVLEEIEDEDEYGQMCAQYFEAMQPVGILEESLVDRYASLQWRIARVMRAERAMIAKGRAEVRLKRRLEGMQRVMFYAERPAIDHVEHFRVSLVCEKVLDRIEKFVLALEWFGLPLSPSFRMELEENFGITHHLPQVKHILDFDFVVQSKVKNIKLDAWWEDKLKDPNLDPDDAKTLKEMTEMARDFAKRMEGLVKMRMESWGEMEWERDEAEEDSRLIPPEKELLALHRGESNYHRMSMHVLHELQRLQSMRLGKPPPLAAALDVNGGSGNGFDL